MTSSHARQLKSGGDPRAFAEYAALRQEMQKLSHPARPDVEWPQVAALCLTLFEKNGIELQSAVWYTLSRAQIAGAAGMAEGLNLVQALLTREWASFWPQHEPTRLELLAGLSRRLQQFLRTQTLEQKDAASLNQAAHLLDEAGDHLQRLALRQQSQLDPLLERIRSALKLLECRDVTPQVATADETAALLIPSTSAPSIHWVYVAADNPARQKTARAPWLMFVAGAASSLLLMALIATAFYLKQPLKAQPDLLTSFPPDAKLLNPENIAMLHATASSADNISGWQQGMEKLQALAQRLDGVDEKRGKYLTVSELKTAVYGMQKAFSASIPLEETLHQLQQQRAEGKEINQAQLLQAEMSLKQLAAQYMLSVSAGQIAQ